MCSISDLTRFVREIEEDFQKTPGLILSEDDAKCLLFSKIHNHLLIQNPNGLETANTGILASSVHSEIKFLDSNDNLSIRPDISIIDVQNLSLINSRHDFDISRKGFVFWGSATLVELKFCKSRRGIDQRFVDKIKRDCEKIEELRKRLYPPEHEHTLTGVVVVFNRTNINHRNLEDLEKFYSNNPHLRIISATANFSYVTNRRRNLT